MKGKKILISCNRILSLGGIEKALTTFIKAFDTENNDVTLVLHNKEGELFKELDLTNVKTIFIEDFDTSSLLTNDIKHFRLFRILKSLYYRFMLRATNDWYARIMYTYKIIAPAITIPGHYDIAMSFTSDYSDLSIVSNVDADKRACMVHGDASINKKHAKLNDPLVNKLDRIYCVSKKTSEQFLSVHPLCSKKIDVFYNIFDSEDIRKKSIEQPSDLIDDGKLTLCTVGRLQDVKGQIMIPQIAKMLLNDGIDFRWYIVGDGNEFQSISNLIAELEVSDYVIMVGAKPNPYPYIQKCDIYVQTSFSEAFCSTTVEAKILHKPVVTTDAPGMREQFDNGINGIISKQMNSESLYKEIKQLIDNPCILSSIKNNLCNQICDNKKELDKIYSFIDQ